MWIGLPVLLAAFGAAESRSGPSRVWSVGPLTRSEPVMGFAVGKGGTTITGPHVDSQTSSTFAATRSIVFARDRIVLVSRVGMRAIPDAKVPATVYQLLSLDAQTGQVMDRREITAFASLPVFATNDAHIIVAGRSVLRLTADLKDAGMFDYHSAGRKHGSIENISPDGSMLGNATMPGFELLDAKTFSAVQVTAGGTVATSVNTKGYVTDNVWWYGKYPNDRGFLTYTDSNGDHLLYHGSCGGRPQFLTDDLILEPGCPSPLIIDIRGNIVRTLSIKDGFSYAGVSQNGKRFALQLTGSGHHERFVIFSVDAGEPIAEIEPDEDGEIQSWSAFSPDGTMFVVGSPLKLTLYRLP